MVDVSKLAKTNWHGKWIWANFPSSAKKKAFNGGYIPDPILREDMNKFVLIRKTFEIGSELKKAIMNITADSRYKLFINGKYVGRGINRCEGNYWYYNSYEISGLLKEGKNVIAVSARWYGKDFAYYTAPDNYNASRSTRGKGGVIFDLNLEYNGHDEWLGSDADARIIINPGQNSDMPFKSSCLGFIEEYDSSKVPKEWNEVYFDDNGWESPQILDYIIKTTIIDENCPLDEEFYYAEEIVNLGECYDSNFDDDDDEDDDDDDEEEGPMDFNVQSMVEGKPMELTSFEVKDENSILGKDGICEIIPKDGSEGKVVSIYFKFPKEMVGYPQLIVEGESGTIVDIIPGEKNRDDYCPEISYLDGKRGSRLILRGGKQFFEQWTWEGYLYMLVKIRNLKSPIKIHKIGTNTTHMRITQMGKFECDNQKLNELWEACAHTVLCCATDGYLDCPSREQRSYMGDAYPEALIANACFGEGRLTKKMIYDCCYGQRSDGIMYSFHPGDAKMENHIIPDYTLYLIQITRDYYEYYKDDEILQQVYPHFVHALNWFWKYIDPATSLLGNVPYWCFIDWSFDHYKPGTWAIINAQLMDVLNFVADLAEQFGTPKVVEKYRSQSKKMKSAIQKLFWNEQEGCYYDYVHEGKQIGLSYMTNSYMVLKDIASEDKWDRILKRIFEFPGSEENIKSQIDDFYLTTKGHGSFGKALKDKVVVAQPFFMHHVNQFFAKVNRFDLMMKYLKKWLPMLEFGKTKTIWETWSKSGSECHAWAATPAYDLSTYWLGVKPLKPGFEKVQIAPTFYGLNQVDGVYPTCKGKIGVTWEKKEENNLISVQVNITIPEKISGGVFIAPNLGEKIPKAVKNIELKSGLNDFLIRY